MDRKGVEEIEAQASFLDHKSSKLNYH